MLKKFLASVEKTTIETYLVAHAFDLDATAEFLEIPCYRLKQRINDLQINVGALKRHVQRTVSLEARKKLYDQIRKVE